MIISRVADSCFWLNRYIERAEASARMIGVHRSVILDAGIHTAARWQPIVAVMGEQARFEAAYGKAGYDSDRDSGNFLTWSEDNPNSIRCSLAGARENARMTREVISREMWENLNTSWQWFNSPDGRKLYRSDRDAFHKRIRRAVAEFNGDAQTTMLHEQAYFFMRLGRLMERADQTVRALSIKRYWTGSGHTKVDAAEESAQWMALLRLCGAVEPFFKRYPAAPTGPLVAQFLLKDLAFPRAMGHCLMRAEQTVADIEADIGHEIETATRKTIAASARKLKTVDVETVSAPEFAAVLSSLLEQLSLISRAANGDFFDPPLKRPKGQRQSQ